MKIEAGKTYKTKNGDTVRILLTDANNKTFPVVGLITYKKDGGEGPMVWTSEGTFHAYGPSIYDLVEPPLEFWCTLYKDRDYHWVGGIYASEEEARNWVPNPPLTFVGLFKLTQVKE
jgi:hypothetical protein